MQAATTSMPARRRFTAGEVLAPEAFPVLQAKTGRLVGPA